MPIGSDLDHHGCCNCSECGSADNYNWNVLHGPQPTTEEEAVGVRITNIEDPDDYPQVEYSRELPEYIPKFLEAYPSRGLKVRGFGLHDSQLRCRKCKVMYTSFLDQWFTEQDAKGLPNWCSVCSERENNEI